MGEELRQKYDLEGVTDEEIKLYLTNDGLRTKGAVGMVNSRDPANDFLTGSVGYITPKDEFIAELIAEGIDPEDDEDKYTFVKMAY